MSRWNIQNIFFFSDDGRRECIEFDLDTVNIITGASGTGKSALIKAVDYCLGSRNCDLPVFVRRKAIAVGVKWKSDAMEMLVARLIPPAGQTTSTKMFVTTGASLEIPANVEALEGAVPKDAARGRIERVFGIADITDREALGNVRGRATIRQATPFMFVTKEVIDSETVLLHGLEKPEKARDIITTMPYFLRAIDEATPVFERELRERRRELEREEAKLRERERAGNLRKARAADLVKEAQGLGLVEAGRTPVEEMNEAGLLAVIQRLREQEPEVMEYPDDSDLGHLYQQRRALLRDIGMTRRHIQATQTTRDDVAGYDRTVRLQRQKLALTERLKLRNVATACPVCDAPSEQGVRMAETLRRMLAQIAAESSVVEAVQPKLIEHEGRLKTTLEEQRQRLNRIEAQIRIILQQQADLKRSADLSKVAAIFHGQIRLFLKYDEEYEKPESIDIDVLRMKISELEGRINQESKNIKIKRAEGKISNFASRNLKYLPTVAPCKNADLEFTAAKPDIRIIEDETDEVLRMADIGSDQNYLAIHLALAFALQEFLGQVKSPVPGLLILDQVSRPYFPSDKEYDVVDIDEMEVDEDREAMRRHIDFLFLETQRLSGLQVLLIEHAYFASDSRYVAATKRHWTRASGKGLIPSDWPERTTR